jgi:hypothetical protein
MSNEDNPFFLMGAMLGEKSGEVTDLRRRIEELEAKLTQQDSLWEAFKHWEGERKYALRIIVKHLKNTPGSDAEGSCAPQADGSGEDS